MGASDHRRLIEGVFTQVKLSNIAWTAYYSIPPAARRFVKLLLKGGSGHRRSLFNDLIARRDARGKCRLDRVSRLLCEDLRAAGIPSIEEKRCLEIGTGYVGSSSVAMWLLGAKTVTSIDLNRLFVPSALKGAILSSEKENLFEILRGSIVSERSLKERIDAVHDWAASGAGRNIGFFEYIAPADVLTSEFSEKFDLIFSVSTLEHLPRSQIDKFVRKTAYAIAEGGMSLHFIDLTDHYDRHGNPLGFLSVAQSDYSEDADADARGNRIRPAEWLTIFRRAGLKADVVISRSASGDRLPAVLASPFDEMSREEILVTDILLRACK